MHEPLNYTQKFVQMRKQQTYITKSLYELQSLSQNMERLIEDLDPRNNVFFTDIDYNMIQCILSEQSVILDSIEVIHKILSEQITSIE